MEFAVEKFATKKNAPITVSTANSTEVNTMSYTEVPPWAGNPKNVNIVSERDPSTRLIIKKLVSTQTREIRGRSEEKFPAKIPVSNKFMAACVVYRHVSLMVSWAEEPL